MSNSEDEYFAALKAAACGLRPRKQALTHPQEKLLKQTMSSLENDSDTSTSTTNKREKKRSRAKTNTQNDGAISPDLASDAPSAKRKPGRAGRKVNDNSSNNHDTPQDVMASDLNGNNNANNGNKRKGASSEDDAEIDTAARKPKKRKDRKTNANKKGKDQNHANWQQQERRRRHQKQQQQRMKQKQQLLADLSTVFYDSATTPQPVMKKTKSMNDIIEDTQKEPKAVEELQSGGGNSERKVSDSEGKAIRPSTEPTQQTQSNDEGEQNDQTSPALNHPPTTNMETSGNDDLEPNVSDEVVSKDVTANDISELPQTVKNVPDDVGASTAQNLSPAKLSAESNDDKIETQTHTTKKNTTKASTNSAKSGSKRTGSTAAPGKKRSRAANKLGCNCRRKKCAVCHNCEQAHCTCQGRITKETKDDEKDNKQTNPPAPTTNSKRTEKPKPEKPRPAPSKATSVSPPKKAAKAQSSNNNNKKENQKISNKKNKIEKSNKTAKSSKSSNKGNKSEDNGKNNDNGKTKKPFTLPNGMPITSIIPPKPAIYSSASPAWVEAPKGGRKKSRGKGMERESKALELLCVAMQPDLNANLLRVMKPIKERLLEAAKKANEELGEIRYTADSVNKQMIASIEEAKLAVRDYKRRCNYGAGKKEPLVSEPSGIKKEHFQIKQPHLIKQSQKDLTTMEIKDESQLDEHQLAREGSHHNQHESTMASTLEKSPDASAIPRQEEKLERKPSGEPKAKRRKSRQKSSPEWWETPQEQYSLSDYLNPEKVSNQQLSTALTALIGSGALPSTKGSTGSKIKVGRGARSKSATPNSSRPGSPRPGSSPQRPSKSRKWGEGTPTSNNPSNNNSGTTTPSSRTVDRVSQDEVLRVPTPEMMTAGILGAFGRGQTADKVESSSETQAMPWLARPHLSPLSSKPNQGTVLSQSVASPAKKDNAVEDGTTNEPQSASGLQEQVLNEEYKQTSQGEQINEDGQEEPRSSQEQLETSSPKTPENTNQGHGELISKVEKEDSNSGNENEQIMSSQYKQELISNNEDNPESELMSLDEAKILPEQVVHAIDQPEEILLETESDKPLSSEEQDAYSREPQQESTTKETSQTKEEQDADVCNKPQAELGLQEQHECLTSSRETQNESLEEEKQPTSQDREEPSNTQNGSLEEGKQPTSQDREEPSNTEPPAKELSLETELEGNVVRDNNQQDNVSREKEPEVDATETSQTLQESAHNSTETKEFLEEKEERGEPRIINENTEQTDETNRVEGENLVSTGIIPISINSVDTNQNSKNPQLPVSVQLPSTEDVILQTEKDCTVDLNSEKQDDFLLET